MQIKQLFESPTFPWHLVLETLDGKFKKFFITP